MHGEFECTIKKCPTCLTFRNRNHSEPIINNLIPSQA